MRAPNRNSYCKRCARTQRVRRGGWARRGCAQLSPGMLGALPPV